jgi:cytochrome oxidase Cu insertion factor (SCO1/SenC/PrrC family)
VLNSRPTRWWRYLGVPVGIAAGAVFAVWLRTSGGDALTLHRGERVDAAFTRRLDSAASPAPEAPHGHFLLVAFGYTYCPDVCPTTLIAVHQALERLGAGAARVVPIFVTIDPARDTADRLRTYVENFDSRIHSVSDPAAVAQAVKAFRARAEKRIISGDNYAMDHTAVLYVLDPERRVIAALPETSPTLSADIADALAGNPGFAVAAPAP